ncbi:MAG TPA: FliH/SctL family protein [bacterium]|nr:FliH/SctL family protein [bacterium]
MSREVLASQDYQYSDTGYLVDNIPWQEEIKKRLEMEFKKRITEPRPTLAPEEFQPLLLPETPEATEVVEEAKEPESTPEEILAKAKLDAEETAKSIEQAAKKNAYEIVEQARWEATDNLAKAKEEAEKEASHIREEAEVEARKIKQIAGDEARAAGMKEGLEKGQQEGFAKGQLEGQQTYSDLIKKWSGLLAETVLERRKLLDDLKPILVELLGESLYRCLKSEGKQNSQMVVEFAKEALAKVQDRVHLRFHVNPEDMEEIKGQKERLQLSIGAKDLELVPDARIEKGGCLLETEAGSVDARLATVADQIKESIGSELLG